MNRLSEYENSVRMQTCKDSAAIYGIFHLQKFIELKQRPNICGVAYCPKCEKDRVNRLKDKYNPYFRAYSGEYVRHLIFTTSVISSSDLPANIDSMLKNVSRFNERVRKSLNYPFRAMCLIEAHYQGREKDTYNFHCHYGIFNRVSVPTLRKMWCDVWGNPDLIVRLPHNKHGKPVYNTHKLAFLDYMARRRAGQARNVPIEHWHEHLQGRQLLKRIGFTKGYLALVKTIRKEDEKNRLPDGYEETYLCKIPVSLSFADFEKHFRRRFENLGSDEYELNTVQHLAWRVARDVLLQMTDQEDTFVVEPCTARPEEPETFLTNEEASFLYNSS